jgi:membrane-associated protease RseP (regulator of RpoE activity)
VTIDPSYPLDAAPVPPISRDRVWLHLSLFLITLATTWLVGVGHYQSFRSQFGAVPVTYTLRDILGGLWYSATILGILGAHEMGHYVACRLYRIDASLPYFLPFLSLTGTLGAVIRIRAPIPSKRALFDVGVSGPIAGFLVAVPALLLGMSLSTIARLPENFSGLELGEPLLFRAVAWLVWGTPASGYTINLHPVAFAAWFGFFATALNLLPVGQLDGGHIAYAVLGRRSAYVTMATFCAILLLAVLVSPTSWIVWAVALAVMLFFFGARHPRIWDEDMPLDSSRRLVALFAVVMFVLCFTPAPIEPLQLLGGR